MRCKTSGLVVLALLPVALLVSGCASVTERTLALFDGRTLEGWEVMRNGPWRVRAGSIYCPTSERIQLLRCAEPLGDDFELRAEISVLGRSRTDGKRIGFLDAEGNWVAVSLDDYVGNSIMIYKGQKALVSESLSGDWERGAHMRLRVEQGIWYGLRCVVRDGRLAVWHGDRHIETSFEAVPPVTLFLEVQRTGAAYRGLELREYTPAEVAPATDRADETLDDALGNAPDKTRNEALAGTVVLFDGESLDGWGGSGPWRVEDGALVYPVTGRKDEALVSEHLITGPCEVSLELQLIRRHFEDSRGFFLRNGEQEINMRLDDRPDEFQLELYPPLRAKQTRSPSPLSEDDWYRLTTRVEADGRVTAWLDGARELSTSWKGGFPLELGLVCQRSGARYRNIVLRELD